MARARQPFTYQSFASQIHQHHQTNGAFFGIDIDDIFCESESLASKLKKEIEQLLESNKTLATNTVAADKVEV